MARRIYCENNGCKYHKQKNICTAPKIKISNEGIVGGMCSSFEKGFLYYINLVKEELHNSNFIPGERMTDDLKIGLYYVMRMFNLGFCQQTWGYAVFFLLYALDDEAHKPLNYKEIAKLPLNEVIMQSDYQDFNRGILPCKKAQKESSQKTTPKCENQPFGWLSPLGEFTPGDFGEHEGAALKIVEQLNLKKEFYESQKGTHLILARDFLAGKGWCLIHDPTNVSGYIVSHEKPLTKKQREFLFGYFTDMGDDFTAQLYLEE